MRNLYHGVTQPLLGASCLNTRAILHVQEGYQIGGTIEYADIGDFKIEDFENEGAFRQTLKISASNQVQWMNKVNTVLPYQLNNHAYWNDRFYSLNTLAQNYFYTGNWEISNNRLGITSDGTAVYNDSNVSDFREIAKFKISRPSFTKTDYDYGIYFRSDSALENGYLFRVFNHKFDIYRKVDSAFTLVGSTATFGITVNTDYWLMVVGRGSNFKGYLSTDGESYTKYADWTDYQFKKGFVGLRTSLAGTYYTTDELDFVEIGRQYTVDDIVKKSMAWGGVENVHIQKDYGVDGFDGFKGNSGSSWSVGITNNYDQVDLKGSSQEWNTYMNCYGMYNGFTASQWFKEESVCFECEMRGSSGARGGLLINSSFGPRGFLNWHAFGSSNNTIDLFGVSVTSRFTHRGEYINLKADAWYKTKLIRRGYFYSWYVNDSLVNSIYGITLCPYFVKIGIGGNGNMSFRNPRISELDDLVVDATFDSGSNPSSILARYLPDGMVINTRGNTTSIFNRHRTFDTGSSEINMSNQNSSQIKNNVNFNSYYGKGQNYSDIDEADSAHIAIAEKMDMSRTKIFNDPNILSRESAEKAAGKSATNEVYKENTVNLRIPIRPQLEKEDAICYRDDGLGISYQYWVNSFQKVYSVQDGFIEDLNLEIKY